MKKGWIGRLFSGSSRRKHDSDDIMGIAKRIGPLMDKTANEIILTYGDQLFSEPITYIVPAVWGATKDGELTPLQRRIHRQIIPVIEAAIERFEFKEISDPQRFAIGYILRGLLISKITYMIETVNKQRIEKLCKESGQESTLRMMETIGNA